MEEKAARAYDCAALKYWGVATHINFQVLNFYIQDFNKRTMWFIGLLLLQLENYQQQLEEMKNMTRQEYVAHLRR